MTIPDHTTTGALARALGLSERRVAALKAEGRIPSTPEGHIDLPGLLADLYRENAGYRERSTQRSGAGRRPEPPATWDERHPTDAASRIAVNMTAGQVPGAVARAALKAGLGEEAAKALHAAMLDAVPGMKARTVQWCGMLLDPDGPDWLSSVLDLDPIK